MYSDETISAYKTLLKESKSELGIREEPGTGTQRLKKEAGAWQTLKNLFRSGDSAADDVTQTFGVGTGKSTGSRFTGKGTAGTNAGVTNTERITRARGAKNTGTNVSSPGGSSGSDLSAGQKAGIGGAGLGLGGLGYAAGRDMGFEEASEESESLRNLAFGSGMALGTSFPQVAEKGYDIMKRVSQPQRRNRRGLNYAGRR